MFLSDSILSRLRDDEIRVRKNSVMVLTHLILNDMIKIKGQISELALRLQDSEQRISDLTRCMALPACLYHSIILSLCVSHSPSTSLYLSFSGRSHHHLQTFLYGARGQGQCHLQHSA